MPVKKILTAGLAGFVMVLLIVDGQAALQSAADGITLCLRTVTPSLFPFLFLCSLITASFWGEKIPWLRRIAKQLGIPKGGESLLLCAFLGGYPAGAQMIGTLFQEGKLNRQEAQRLLPLCNNAGPAFLFGMVAMQFPSMDMVAALWVIQILSVFFAGAFTAGSNASSVSLCGNKSSISEILNRSVRTMAVICGWILLFQIMNGFLDRWVLWYFPREFRILIRGILELSAGCCGLGQIASPDLRFLVCTLMLSFGGLCVTMQTASVIGDLSLPQYIGAKLLQTAAAAIMAAAYLQLGWGFLAAISVMILFLPMCTKNNCRFSSVCDV